MSLVADDIQRLHASFGDVCELVNRRRAIYALSAELAQIVGNEDREGAPADVLDNPVTRAHIGEVLSGVVAFDPARLSSLDGLVSSDGRVRIHDHEVHLASTARAGRELRGALRVVDAELARRHDGSVPSALILEDEASFASVTATLAAGIELAAEVSPELALDLLPHVALFAVVSAGTSGHLGSASVREFPGLVLLPETGDPLEVAEALIHEGAHQKFYDLVLTCSILDADPGTRYSPPWAAPGAPEWPYEQCVAAFHAYSCLAAFSDALFELGKAPTHEGSLLAVAADRARAIGEWLSKNGGALGTDGQRLVASLSGSEVDATGRQHDAERVLAHLHTSPHRVGTRDCGAWTLLIEWQRPAVVLWAPSKVVASGATLTLPTEWKPLGAGE